MVVQGLLDLALARAGIAVEQRLGGHDHAVAAIAALAGLLLDEGALQRVELVDRAQSLERGDGSLRSGRHRHRAGARGLAVDQHGARAALGEPAAELRAVQLQVVAQDVKERRVGRDRRHLSRRAVHPQCEVGHDFLRTGFLCLLGANALSSPAQTLGVEATLRVFNAYAPSPMSASAKQTIAQNSGYS